MAQTHKKSQEANHACYYLLCKSKSHATCTNCHKRIVSGSLLYHVITTVVKALVGIMTGSRVLLAEAVHSFTDCVAFGINYFGDRSFKVSIFWKSVIIGIIMFLSGIWILSDNVAIIFAHIPPRPGLLAAFVAGISIFFNGHLFMVSACASRQKPEDRNIYMCMVQNRTNFFAASFAFVGILLAEFGLVFFDPIGAVFIGCFQIRGAFQMFQEAFGKERPDDVRMKRQVSTILYVMTVFIVLFFANDVHDALSRRKVILIPSQGATLDMPVDNMLGRAANFFIVDLKANRTEILVNKSRYYNVRASAVLEALVKERKIGIVLAGKVGPEMFSDLRATGVRIYYMERPGTVREAFADYQAGRLKLATSANVNVGFGRAQTRWLKPW